MRGLGLRVHGGLARTGVRAEWMEQDGPNVTIIGELDAIGCKSHPMADPVNGTAHACGHHAQIAAMIGAALALTNEEVQASLSGSVSFLPFRRKNTLMQINVHGFGKRKSASRHPEKAS